MLACVLLGMIIGTVTEVTARTCRLWLYRRPHTPVVNVIGMFGFIMGGLAAAAGHLGTAATFGLAAAIGLAYELANLHILDWWYFPDQRMAVVRGHTAIVLTLTLTWGLVPLMIAAARSAWS